MMNLTIIVALLQAVMSFLTSSVGTPNQQAAIDLANRAIVLAQQSLYEVMPTSTAGTAQATSTMNEPQPSAPTAPIDNQLSTNPAPIVNQPTSTPVSIDFGPVSIVNLTATPAQVQSGEKVKLSWQIKSNGKEGYNIYVMGLGVNRMVGYNLESYEVEFEPVGTFEVKVEAIGAYSSNTGSATTSITIK